MQLLFKVVEKVLKNEEFTMDDEYRGHALILIGHFMSCYSYEEIKPYFSDCVTVNIDYL